MNVPKMVENDIKRCVWILRTCFQMHNCIPLKSHPPSKFKRLINALLAYKITISINVPYMVANDIKRCVWILRTCLQMYSCIPLKSHPPEQI